MKKGLNIRNIAFLIWTIVLVVVILVMPDMDRLVREKGQIELPSYTQSEQAAIRLDQLQSDGQDAYEFALVFHDDEGLSSEQLTEIDGAISSINNKADSLGIVHLLAHTDSPEAENQLASEDGTTILTQISISKNQGTVEEIAENIKNPIELETVKMYMTGSDLVIDDFAKATAEGVKKTEIIAIIFILIILIVIFRSPIVPLISLITVGISYMISLGIIGLLVDHFNYPFSNFTQVFLVVILFGIGTDYNILLYTTFKEQLAKTGNTLKAISNTYKTSGRTVLYSGAAVFIGFLALMLAEFKLYRASSPVAIGVFVLLLVLITLNPFFMGILGTKMFWPRKKMDSHGEQKLWHFLAKHAYARPFLLLLLVGVLILPFISKYSGDLNYNDLVEIDDKYESKQAIAIIENHYLAGFSSPISLVIDSEQPLNTSENLQTIDALTDAIQNVPGVAKVYSVTRPEAELIDELYLRDQASTLNSGLFDAQDGVTTIHDGLSEANEALLQERDLSGVQQLIEGTGTLQSGAGQLQQALQNLESGIMRSAAGADELHTGLQTVQQNITSLSSGVNQLRDAYEDLEVGFGQFSTYFSGTVDMVKQAKAGYQQIEQAMQTLLQSNEAMASDEHVQTVLAISQQAIQELSVVETQANEIAAQYAKAINGFIAANDTLESVQAGTEQLHTGVGELTNGAGSLSTGLEQASDGSGQITAQSGQFVTGLDKVYDGQQQLQSKLTELQTQLTALSEGLSDSTEGLNEIHAGLEEANTYLTGLSAAQTGTFYIPIEVLEGEEFAKSTDMYMSDDYQMTSMTIILDVNPYTEEAMEIGREIREVTQSFLQATTLDNAEAFLGGKTMSNIDLQELSKQDFIRSAAVMLIGIGIVLLLITRSIFQSIVILGALLLTTLASLGLVEIFNTSLIQAEALSWNVPFFTFIMIVSLGVDYSIFLMMKYNEEKAIGTAGIIEAANKIGGVVVAAAVILGGTFAALYPSGILTLIQISTAVIIGLILLSLVMMPIFIPACISAVEKIKKFSFKKNE